MGNIVQSVGALIASAAVAIASLVGGGPSTVNPSLLTTTQLSQELKSSGTQYKKQTATAQKKTLARIQTVASERKKRLEKLAREKPSDFLKEALSLDDLKDIPAEVKPDVEYRGKVQGKLTVIYFEPDRPTAADKKNAPVTVSTDQYDFLLQPDAGQVVSGNLNVEFAQNPPIYFTSGSTVAIEGVGIGGILVSADSTSKSLNLVSEYQTTYKGEGQIAVIPFNFANDRSIPANPDDLRRYLFTDSDSVRSFYSENSFGQFTFNGTIFPLVTIPYDKGRNTCMSEYIAWATAAETVLFTQGVSLAAYPYRMFVFPYDSGCPSTAWAGGGGTPVRSWITSYAVMKDVLSHELGHNLGMLHANAAYCGATTISTDPNYLFSDCNLSEYGDHFDVMGGSNYYQFNGPHKAHLQWFDPAQSQTVAASGTFHISALEEQSGATKILKIPLSNSSESYYLSFRKAIGFDSSLPSGITQGVQLHAYNDHSDYGNNSSGTYQLDTSPMANNWTFDDASLQDGKSFTDSVNGVTITQVSHTISEAVVEVSLAALDCRRADPLVSLIPEHYIYDPAKNTEYTFTITNQDSPGCEPQQFSAYANVYPYQSNWTVSASPTMFTLSPSESSTGKVNVYHPYNITPDTYTIQLSVSAYSAQHGKVVESTLEIPGAITNVQIQANATSTTFPGVPIQLSALAYNNGAPLWQNVTYEWGTSSTNGIGNLSPNHNIATFTPLAVGEGDIYVIARYAGLQVMSSIHITVLPGAVMVSPNPTSFPTFTLIDFKNVLLRYLNTADEAYIPIDQKVNNLDAGYVRSLIPAPSP